MAPTTPRDRQRFLADLHEIDRRAILEAMAYQDELSLRAAGTPGDPRTPKQPWPARAPGKHVSICRPHMSAGIHGRADARTRSFEPDDGATGLAGRKLRQAAGEREQFSLHLEYAVQSARCARKRPACICGNAYDTPADACCLTASIPDAGAKSPLDPSHKLGSARFHGTLIWIEMNEVCVPG
jgi:hypothetical protein